MLVYVPAQTDLAPVLQVGLVEGVATDVPVAGTDQNAPKSAPATRTVPATLRRDAYVTQDG